LKRLLLVISLLLLAACAPVTSERFVTFTPAGSSTTPTQETVTWTPEPTLTQLPNGGGELGLVEANPNMLYCDVFYAHTRPRFSEFIGQAPRIVSEPRNMSFDGHAYAQNTPPFVFCDEDKSNSPAENTWNSGTGVYRMEITQIDGLWGWQSPNILYTPGECYFGVLRGSSEFDNSTTQQMLDDNIQLLAILYAENGLQWTLNGQTPPMYGTWGEKGGGFVFPFRLGDGYHNYYLWMGVNINFAVFVNSSLTFDWWEVWHDPTGGHCEGLEPLNSINVDGR